MSARDIARSAKIITIPDGKNLSESLLVDAVDEGKLLDEPMALPHEDTTPPCDGKTGLQLKFQGSSATVTYSRS
jgi:hypothetical protein